MLKYIIIILLLITNSLSTYIRICNHGGYLAKCYFETRSFSSIIETFKYDTELFPILQCSRIDIPFDATWSRLECNALVFIATYKTIFTEEFPLALLNMCYTITGTILNPSWSQTRC